MSILHWIFVVVCAGADDKPENTLRIHREITTTLTNNGSSKSTQLDLFVLRRLSKLIDHNGQSYCRTYYRLLVYELLYLWNAMPSSSRETLGVVVSGELCFFFTANLFSTSIPRFIIFYDRQWKAILRICTELKNNIEI